MLAAAEPAGRERISVSPTAAQPRMNPQLSQAYTLLQSGNLDEARAIYTKLSQTEPLNVDALLGLAYIAAQENRSDDAMKLYLRILQFNPRHAVAQGALIGLMGRADPAASESRLKQLIAREPSPFLHFVLGNLYADQSHWAQAQQSYFQAHHLEPDNPGLRVQPRRRSRSAAPDRSSRSTSTAAPRASRQRKGGRTSTSRTPGNASAP